MKFTTVIAAVVVAASITPSFAACDLKEKEKELTSVMEGLKNNEAAQQKLLDRLMADGPKVEALEKDGKLDEACEVAEGIIDYANGL
ncbi:hypothetical protein [Methyloraptor flagellatus]|uniref:Uncharacterized protein n=1 Tax=Methyloraptor flagellatus TaxID=3162530 RepID=A0AAU7XCZ8_9HYPH